MELPTELKGLYRHWPLHSGEQVNHASLQLPEFFSKELIPFVEERMHIWKQKVTGGEPPYTKDPILEKYRFCNIFREFDKQTILFHKKLNPFRDDFPLWLLNMFYARLVARPETLDEIGLLSFDKEENKKLYKRFIALPRPRFGVPYVFPVSVIQKTKTPTRELFLTQYLPEAIPLVATEISTWDRISVYEGLSRVLPIFKYNLSFLWTEVLIDVAYQYPDRLDLFGRFPVGPGSLPTCHRIDATKDPSLLVTDLASKVFLDSGVIYSGQPLKLSAENWEGIGCEFRKYTNLQKGEGRRRIYRTKPVHG